MAVFFRLPYPSFLHNGEGFKGVQCIEEATKRRLDASLNPVNQSPIGSAGLQYHIKVGLRLETGNRSGN